VFLMTKTFAPQERSADSARRHLEGSLRRLRTDRLDLWQLHAIASPDDVDRAFAPGGAMEAILQARDEGVVRFVGVTGHARPDAHLRALEHFDRGMRFDTVQMPVNPIDALQQSFQRQVLPSLNARRLGVLAMKTSASGALVKQGICSHAECLRYVLGLDSGRDVDVLIVGMETPEQVRENARVLRELGPLDMQGQLELLGRIGARAALDLEWYKAG